MFTTLRVMRLAAALAAPFAIPPALAQTPADAIMVAEGDAPGAYTVLAPVSATVHQTSLFPSTSSKTLLDRQLQAEAAKLGADAVIQVRYDMVNALTSREGHKAMGVAVKYVGLQSAEAVPSAPAPSSPASVASAHHPAPAPQSQTAIAPQSAPAPAPAAPMTHTAEATAVVPAPVPAPVPAAPRGPTPAGQIMLSEQDIPGRPHQQLGEVRATARQTSLFPKVPVMEQLNAALREEAGKLGADAVVMIEYETYNPLLSRRGAAATGIAVKFQ